MSVRAKFKVDSITDYGQQKDIRMSPVHSGSEENKAFWKWTPSGSLVLGTINEEAAKQFVPGKEFYIDFTSAGEV